MSEMYFSCDVESTGPVPGLYSMLSIGVTALHPETLVEVGHFYQKLKPLPDAREDLDTMRWWRGFPDQYAEATSDPRDPRDVMRELEDWIQKTVNGFGSDRENRPKPIFVAYPVAFDFGFYSYYAWRFTGGARFGFVGLDMASLAMGHNGRPYDGQTKKSWVARWVQPEDRVAIHHALLDARQQADILRRQMMDICPKFELAHRAAQLREGPPIGFHVDVKLTGGWVEAIVVEAPLNPPEDARPYLPSGCWVLFDAPEMPGGKCLGYFGPDEWRLP